MGGRAEKVVKMAAATVVRSKGNQFSGIKSVSPSSNLGKLLGIPVPQRSDIDVMISKFIKLNSRRGKVMKKGIFTEEKLKELLVENDKIGIREITKLLS